MLILEYILFAIGINFIIERLLHVRNVIVSLRANKNLEDYGKNSWAIITACTDGIGQGFAVTLAKKRFNIIQVGRNPEKLNATANDLISKYGIQVKNIVKDFSLCPRDPINFFNDIYLQTKDLDISIIINNIGTGSGAVHFIDTPLEKIFNQIALNLFPICFMSRLFLPKLLNRPQGGAIINLSSVARHILERNRIQYSSCKSFDFVISDTMSSEVSISEKLGKIDVLCLQPGFVDTPLTKYHQFKPLEINRYECAEAALHCLGNTSETAGHWKHLILMTMITIVSFFR